MPIITEHGPAGTQHWNNVDSLLNQRWIDVVSTLCVAKHLIRVEWRWAHMLPGRICAPAQMWLLFTSLSQWFVKIELHNKVSISISLSHSLSVSLCLSLSLSLSLWMYKQITLFKMRCTKRQQPRPTSDVQKKKKRQWKKTTKKKTTTTKKKKTKKKKKKKKKKPQWSNL